MRGKRAALSTVLLAAFALLAGGLALRDRLREAWYIHRLRSPDHATRLAAAERIADLKLVAAVPELIRLIEEEDKKEGCNLYLDMHGVDVVVLSRLAHCVYRVGRAAEPILDRVSERHGGSAQFGQDSCMGETDRALSVLSAIK